MICKECGKGIEGYRKKKYCNFCSIKRTKIRGSESSRKRMIRNREFVRDYKKNKKCELCGYNKHPEILVFHHKNKKNKNKGVNTLMKTLKSIEIIKKEMDKCLLVCANCHREIHLFEKKS